MARTLSSPVLLSRSDVIVVGVHEELPFPLESLYWAANDTHVVAIPKARARRYVEKAESQGLRFGGLGYRSSEGATPLWLVRPASPPTVQELAVTHKKLVMAGVAGFILFAATMHRVNASHERQLHELERKISRIQSGAAFSKNGLSATPELLAQIANNVPSGVELLEINIDSARRSVAVRARSAQYGGVSDLVEKLSNVPALRNVRAQKAQLASQGPRSMVDFTVEAELP